MEKEIWKDIKLHDDEIRYEISNFGIVKNKKTDTFMKLSSTHDGYITCSLIISKGVCKRMSVHRLVGNVFIENPFNLPVIHHKNSIKSDNRVSNLEWVTHSDNMKETYKNPNRKKYQKAIVQFDGLDKKNIINEFVSIREASKILNVSESMIASNLVGRRKSKNYFFAYANPNKIVSEDDLKDFIKIKNHPEYLIHQDSRAYSTYMQSFLTPVIASGYYNTVLNNKKYKLHRLVLSNFIVKPVGKDFVNHKDGNKLNNHLNNLEWVTREENAQHAVDTGLNTCVKVVYQYNLNGKLLNSYKSLKEAQRQTGISSNTISYCCRNKSKTSGNYIWSFDNKVVKTQTRYLHNKQGIIQYDLNGNYINEYESYRDASVNVFGIYEYYYVISECCNNKRESYNGYIFIKK